MENPERLKECRAGIYFETCLLSCLCNAELLAEYDRLNGTQLLADQTRIVLRPRRAGKNSEIHAFVDFCYNEVFLRIALNCTYNTGSIHLDREPPP